MHLRPWCGGRDGLTAGAPASAGAVPRGPFWQSLAMGILRRLFGRDSSLSAAVSQEDPRRQPEPASVVMVAFRDLESRAPLANFSPEWGYAYLWPFADEPQVGDWAVAPGLDGPATVIVGMVGQCNDIPRRELKKLIRLVPAEEVRAVRGSWRTDEQAWLNQARTLLSLDVYDAEGLEPQGNDRPSLLLPCDTASVHVADAQGRAWTRAHHLSKELGMAEDEWAAFKEVAVQWFAVRSSQEKSAHGAAIERLVDRLEGLNLRAELVGRSPADVEGLVLAGTPLPDWLDVVKFLVEDGRPEEALRLVHVLIEAAEEEARLSKREPTPAYTERAAMIYRKQRRYAEEIAIIERWEAACPPDQRGPGAGQERLAHRLERARALSKM